MPPSTFVHLSDIHFRQDANTPYDAFKDLRNELERDIVALGEEIGGVNAVLISGDIAFSGASAEYKIAREWLQRLTTKLACPLENVWVTPGNHDVDRNAIKKSMLLRDVHRNLRKDEGDLDQKLAQYLVACL